MKEQWKQGLQWGALIWLSWISVSSVARVIECAHFGLSAQSILPAVGWLLALALVWTRWSRLGIAIGIAAQVYAGAFVYPPVVQHVDVQIGDTMSQSYLDLEPLMTSFLPRCLPLLPLLFMAPLRPRYTAALALVGRWTDAARELSGLRWILVAAGVLALHSAAPEALRWWGIDEDGRVFFQTWRVAGALVPCVILFGLAALPRPRDRVATG
jgi:hypothetical protein